MKKHINILSIIGLIIIIYSCTTKENNIQEFSKTSPKSKYSYKPFRSTYPSETFINELDTSEWMFNSYLIYPSNKSSFNMSTNDSLYYHRITNKTSDFYSFQPSNGLIFKNDVKIGTIKKEKIDFDTIKDPYGKELGVRYNTLFYISQPKDSIMNGLFNVNFSKNQRLHITQVRTNNETKKEEVIKLIFYKK